MIINDSYVITKFLFVQASRVFSLMTQGLQVVLMIRQ